ncbi:MAG: hypothetical protein LLG05_03290 [Porphyromonadaceae bacterium]|nr:hypothetical protein [Porphyromonadaceae bacterium]
MRHLEELKVGSMVIVISPQNSWAEKVTHINEQVIRCSPGYFSRIDGSVHESFAYTETYANSYIEPYSQEKFKELKEEAKRKALIDMLEDYDYNNLPLYILHKIAEKIKPYQNI